ncbi:ABC transporter permease [Leucobacter allii]|uniref:ABC transporter permease n=1 Tax=Leucobacter allii TaxID=2932247 RepID=UPI001FD09BEE|nr:ABC transporter permease [Leucobacter allii]UOR01331.1 ABC transporter permease [Leucobacter allii]
MSTTAPNTPTTVSQVITRKGSGLRLVANWALPILLAVIIIVAAATTPRFLSFDNIRAVLINTSITGIVAVGMTPITLSGNFFSLGATQSTVLSAVLFLSVGNATGSILLGAAAAVVVLCLVGLAQGLVVAAGLNPIITTLAVGTIIFGLVTLFTNGEVVVPQGIDIGWLAVSNFLGLPLPVYIFAVYLLINWFLMERSLVGRRIMLMGANKQTAVNSGISVRRTTTWAFLSMSIGIAIAGILSAAQLRQVQSGDLTTLTMDVVAAVLVGGSAIQGGDGSPLRSALGALLIVVLGNIMLLQGFPTGVRLLGVGLLVVIVVSVLHVLRKATAR